MTSTSSTGLSRRGFLTGAAGVAAAAATTISLAGCSTRASSADEPLQFWQFYAPLSGTGQVKTQSDWFEKAVRDWNTRHRQQVRNVYIPNFTDPSNTRLATAFASGDGPDVFLISPGDFLRYSNGGALLDLAPYMTQEAIDDFDPDILATRRIGKGVYGLPMEVEPLAMYYSVPAWEKAHLSEGDIPRTWDQMLDVAHRLTTDKQSGLVFETVPGYFQNFTWYPWMWQGGGDVVDEHQKPSFDSAPVTAALELFGRSVSTGVAPRTDPAAGDLPGAFAAGYAAMWQSGIWQVAGFRGEQPKFDYGIFPLPTPPGGTPRTVLGGWAWCVNARGRNPEAAAKFVVETVGSMADDSVQRLVDWCTVAKSDMPPRRSVDRVMQAKGAYDDAKLKFFHDVVLPTGRGEPRYPPVVYKAISDAIQQVQAAGGDAAGQAARAESAIEAFMQTYQGATLL
ncbi:MULTISPECIES: ABC transporter substrate-binding protein [unclassified Curtobacterium]|uniref:ABC transporter substrate-binding protein n=1 Tax=unclassified Curtobacterium TaxID=257496 RepID=UPI000DA72C2E|nr:MULTISPECIES: sugar ABC transporter substrate-binding protein [unclassified Curtobacterium]PZE23181.1 sugar ABC transporter substrate-binding protein [Curtobacterium sp. MCBD17_028]PZF56409.1 sugar ABC transporter substrate-binding protein [Curtobacterium sp. MCBD17_034]PZM33277.1 sugar ABC transporter substrate-binding protein [Curtobacterium sp. MCBD17_031]